MIRNVRLWALVSIAIFASACGSGGPAVESERTTGEEPVATVDTVTDLAPAAVLVIHQVADYDAWKLVFDDHMQARMDATCLGHSLKRGLDDPDRVYVYCLATDADRLRAFLDGDDLAGIMKQAGVQGNSTILLLKPMLRNLVSGELLPGIIVTHAVEDYEVWREAYDAFDDFRRKSGIVGHAVTRMFDDPNRLVVYHQARSADELRAFVDSEELKEAMQRAGVVGQPDIHFIQVVEFADY